MPWAPKCLWQWFSAPPPPPSPSPSSVQCCGLFLSAGRQLLKQKPVLFRHLSTTLSSFFRHILSISLCFLLLFFNLSSMIVKKSRRGRRGLFIWAGWQLMSWSLGFRQNDLFCLLVRFSFSFFAWSSISSGFRLAELIVSYWKSSSPVSTKSSP